MFLSPMETERKPERKREMQKLYHFLGRMLWVFIGVFIGSSVYRYCDYITHRELYATYSAPWYSSIQINAIFTLITVTGIFLCMLAIKRKMK